MLACVRALGIPGRYVSGYLFGGQASGVRGDQATHAWLECRLPDGRWFGLDPTNALVANDHYVRVHTGRDYADVTPTRGVYTGYRATTLDVSVHVERVPVEV
jgi:transglutaminase-like putative cysteine protease